MILILHMAHIFNILGTYESRLEIFVDVVDFKDI